MEHYYSIKDKVNLASHYVWSGGDYDTISEELIHSSNVQYKRSMGYHINGDYSLQVNFDGSAWSWINLWSMDNDVGETYHIRLKISNDSQPVTVRLIELPSHFVDAVVSVNNLVQTVDLSLTTNSVSTVKLQINTSNASTVYVDDVSIFKF